MNTRKFLLWWTLANTTRFIVSYLGTLVTYLSFFATEGTPELAVLVIVGGPGIAGGVAGGIVGGFMQWFALRRRIPRAGLWASIGAVCFAAGYAVTVQLVALVFFIGVLASGGTIGPALKNGIAGGDMLGVVIVGMTIGIGNGVVSGLAQWLIMRQYVSRSGWWILANSAGLTIDSIVSLVGTPIAIAISLALVDPDVVSALTNLTSLIVVRCLEMVAGVVVGGAITGRALARLLRHPFQDASGGEPKPTGDTADRGTSKQAPDNFEDGSAVTAADG